MDIEFDLPSPPRLFEKLDALAQQQQCIFTQNTQLAAQNAALINQNAAMAARLTALEQLVASRASDSEVNSDWRCPVCSATLTTRESFKGHIRRLVKPASENTHCFLDPDNAEHQAMLSHSRYGQGDFNTRATVFKTMLYETVKSNTRSTMSSESSFSAVCARCSLFGCVLLLKFELIGCADS